MKTATLIGPALDWAVAKCEMPTNKTGWIGMAKAHQYSANWAQGGPIIEREWLTVRKEVYAWGAFKTADDNGFWSIGDTPLIAAMRCYVASKMGDEVKIPAGL